MRIKLRLPSKMVFKHAIRIRTSDINFAGHLGNERILIYAQESRAEWLLHYGYSEKNICGTHTLVADAAIQYLQEGFAHDELDIHLYLGDMHRYGFDLYYDVRRRAGNIDETSATIAIAKTAVLFRNNQTNELTSAPDALLQAIE